MTYDPQSLRNAVIEECCAVLDREITFFDEQRKLSNEEATKLRNDGVVGDAYWGSETMSKNRHWHTALSVTQNQVALLRGLKSP